MEDENKSLKNLLRPIVQYVNEEVEKSEQRLKKSFPTDTKGDLGPQGERGPKGDQGDSGGPSGPKGEQGNIGTTGERGEQGFLGEQGPHGEQGDVGPQGERGERGFLGEQGPHGEQGIQGIRGFTGDKGDPGGPPGPKGEQGNIGTTGERGEQGVLGESGTRGARGQRGQKGDLGPKGEAGERGQVGTRGERGNPGEQGESGEPGNTKQLEENFDSLREDVAVQIRQTRSSLMGSLAGGPGSGAIRVMDQDDVKPGTPADGQILKYSSSEGKFVLSAASAGTDFTSDIADLVTANTIQNTDLGNLSAQTASLVTANTIQNVELGNLGAQTAIWTENGSDVYLTDTSNYLGIGTNNPNRLLHIKLNTSSVINEAQVRIENDHAEGDSYIHYDVPDTAWATGIDADDNNYENSFKIVNGNDVSDPFVDGPDGVSRAAASFVATRYGKVGIANSNPTHTLTIGGTAGSTPNTFTVPSGMTAHTLDLLQSNLFLIKLEENVEITLSNIAAAAGAAFTIIVTQDGTGSRTWAWAAGTAPKFPGGFATTLSTAVNAIDIISLVVANSTFVYSTTGLNYK